jgi:hypothetical protein
MARATKVKAADAIEIARPLFREITVHIKGNAPLVIRRFSEKFKQETTEKVVHGGVGGRRRRAFEARDLDDLFNEARYRSPEGWDGVHAGAFRAALISACRLVGFQMTRAKLALFVVPDGYDEKEPQIPLIRLYGDPKRQEDICRTVTGDPMLAVRARYDDWSAKLRIRYDADQFKQDDVVNLLMRAGMQCGICEGRPDSKKSAGMGWGTFEVVGFE